MLQFIKIDSSPLILKRAAVSKQQLLVVETSLWQPGSFSGGLLAGRATHQRLPPDYHDSKRELQRPTTCLFCLGLHDLLLHLPLPLPLPLFVWLCRLRRKHSFITKVQREDAPAVGAAASCCNISRRSV